MHRRRSMNKIHCQYLHTYFGSILRRPNTVSSVEPLLDILFSANKSSSCRTLYRPCPDCFSRRSASTLPARWGTSALAPGSAATGFHCVPANRSSCSLKTRFSSCHIIIGGGTPPFRRTRPVFISCLLWPEGVG